MWKVSFGRQLNLTRKGQKTKRPIDHQVTANEGHYAGQFYTLHRWVFGIGYWVFCTAQRHCCSFSMCANLLMRLAHISICLMNCYRTHSFRVADLLLFIYSLRRVICRRLSFDLERFWFGFGFGFGWGFVGEWGEWRKGTSWVRSWPLGQRN